MAALAPLLLAEDNVDEVALALRAFRQSQFANPSVTAHAGVKPLGPANFQGSVKSIGLFWRVANQARPAALAAA
jgi:hypothetical protein